MEKNNLVLFHNYLIKLFTLLKQSSDDKVPSLVSKSYQKYKKVDRKTYINHTLTKLQPHIKYVLEEDPFLFSPEYSSEPLRLISGIDFKEIWYDLPNEIQGEVWTCLKNVYIAGSFSLGVGTKDPMVRALLKSLAEGKQLAVEAGTDSESSDVEGDLESLNAPMNILSQVFNNETCPNLESLQGLFNEENVLIKLAKEVGEELSHTNVLETLGIDPNRDYDNPIEAITQLFSQDPKKLENLMNTFGEKFKEKMEANQLAEEDLVKATSEIGQKFAETLNLPGLTEQLNPNVNIEEALEEAIAALEPPHEESEEWKRLQALMKGGDSAEKKDMGKN